MNVMCSYEVTQMHQDQLVTGYLVGLAFAHQQPTLAAVTIPVVHPLQSM